MEELTDILVGLEQRINAYKSRYQELEKKRRRLDDEIATIKKYLELAETLYRVEADKAKLAAAGVLVVAAVATFYALGKQDLWLRVIALLVLIAGAVAVFFTVPLFIAVLSQLFFRDRVGWRRWSAWPSSPWRPSCAR